MNIQPEDYFNNGTIEMARFGTNTILKNNMSVTQRNQIIKRLQKEYPKMKKKINRRILSIRKRDPEKFCVKVNKYFQSDETQSMRTNLKGSIFYGKSIERNVERVCEQPAFYQYDGDHEQHEGIVQ